MVDYAFTEIPDDTFADVLDAIDDTPTYFEPGKEHKCPDCGKKVTAKQNGELRSHKCEPEHEQLSRPTKDRPSKNVRNLGIAVLAGGVEYVTSQGVSRYVPCHPSQVPADLGPEAGLMVGPIIDLVWPSIPENAQKILTRIANENELMACFFAWARYFKRMQSFATDAHRMVQEQQNTLGGQTHEPFSGKANGSSNRPGNVVPFFDANAN
jgi:hypothetical protein